MRIHHLNCGSMSPPFVRMEAIVYCLLVETNGGLVLVDTGFGTQDCTRPTTLMRSFAFVIGAPLAIEETAAYQVRRLGYDISDVRHIVLTHLHLDHTGGLPDFPEATVHVFRQEYETASRPKGLIERGHVRAHWAHSPNWRIHDLSGEKWYGFDCERIVKGLSPEILLIPLPGHTRGHCGVAVETAEGWLFQCGDAASPFHPEVDPHATAHTNYPLARFPRSFVRRVIGPHVPRLRELIGEYGAEVRLISSHDIYSFVLNTSRASCSR